MKSSYCNLILKQEAVQFDPTLTFWCYLLVRTLLGVLTAASLMMFEGAVMATIQEMGGDYGLQRFVGNFGAIIFAPLGGFLIDTSSWDLTKTDFSSVFYVYLGLKMLAAFLILFIRYSLACLSVSAYFVQGWILNLLESRSWLM